MKKEKDNFSKQSERYQKFRPSYPQGLIDSICNYALDRTLAWDCATGNGQVASLLSRKFESVIATDISEQQLKNASPERNITYKIERAENSSLKTNSVDLIIVAQAIHWFDFNAFYAEVRRVLRKNGILAVIGYPLFSTENEELNALILKFYTDTLGGYWDIERTYIDERYKTIPFPLKEFTIPESEIKYVWTAEQILGYLESWSAVEHYRKDKGKNPIDLIRKEVNDIINSQAGIGVRFEIIGRYGEYLG